MAVVASTCRADGAGDMGLTMQWHTSRFTVAHLQAQTEEVLCDSLPRQRVQQLDLREDASAQRIQMEPNTAAHIVYMQSPLKAPSATGGLKCSGGVRSMDRTMLQFECISSDTSPGSPPRTLPAAGRPPST